MSRFWPLGTVVRSGVFAAAAAGTCNFRYSQCDAVAASAPKGKLPDCEVPACSSTMKNLNRAMMGTKSNGAAIPSSRNSSTPVAAAAHVPVDCPASIEELGNSAWTLLHTMAEHISEHPDAAEQQQIVAFVTGMAALYPCRVCRVRVVTCLRLRLRLLLSG